MPDALTPAKVRDRLSAKLEKRRAEIRKLHAYYAGDHPLPTAPDTKNESYKRLAALAQANMTGLVVDAVGERLEVDGITLGSGQERQAAEDIWRDFWQANDLDGWSSAVHDEALIAKRAFVLVWPDGDGGAVATPELASEMIVSYEAGGRRRRAAALKQFVDDDETFAVLWLPESVHYWRKGNHSSKWEAWAAGADLDPQARLEMGDWIAFLAGELDTSELGDAVVWTSSNSDGAMVVNPLGVVPVVEFLARPDVSGKPRGEITEGVIHVQDRINKTLLDRLVAAEFTAFPQRWAVGLDPEDSEGKPRRLDSGPERVWIAENDKAQFGQLGQGSLDPYLKAVESDVQVLAAMTKTPVYYLASTFANVGADTIVAVDAGLVKKVRAHQRIFGDAWAEVVRLGLQVVGDPRADDPGLAVGWRDPEVRTRAELADWAIKVKDVIPLEDVWKGLGASAHDIERMRAALAKAALEKGVNPLDLALLAQKIYLAVPSVLSAEEAREIMRAAGADLSELPELPEPRAA